ncbi:hypothetical protein R1sor_003463 [Riccia sorocarpa]|uniref:histidine kinase n=1 Tax=Riccia sorocarpa TaxID=122646 RepID=A0ABD3H3U0_9MARC
MDRRHQWAPESLADESSIIRERVFADPGRLVELLQSSEPGLVQLATLAKQWDKRQQHAFRLLQQERDTLALQRLEAERKQRQILEELWSPRPDSLGLSTERENGAELTSPMEEDEAIGIRVSGPSSLVVSVSGMLGDEEEESLEYWKEKAKSLGRLLAESLQREQVLLSRLQESVVDPTRPLPMEALQVHLHRLDNFLHFTLRKAPVVLAHQDTELRYRFIYNAFPTLSEEEVIGKTDTDIYSGSGVVEAMEFKREVMQRGVPAKREIRFDTDLFGTKTFFVAAEPVFSKTREILGVNYVAMDVSEEAAKREKLMTLREDIAVQKAMESELNKTIDITEETMRAKQMLATMSHEIRSPLSGVVSMAEVLATTKLDAEQRQLVDVMMSSGDLVLQLINDILDLSKVESGAMKLESKKFRPREVVKHVLQMNFASVPQHKHLVLEGDIADEVPLELIGDVLRIRQVFTNLVSNAIKFTHKGVVSIKMSLGSIPSNTTYAKWEMTTACKSVSSVGSAPSSESSSLSQMVEDNRASLSSSLARKASESDNQVDTKDGSDSSGVSRSISTASSVSTLSSASSVLSSMSSTASTLSSASSYSAKYLDEASSVLEPAAPGGLWDTTNSCRAEEVVWLHCEVCDTGIGIPEAALPTLFEKYTQVSTTHARKYGGTGLGLAICKQLVGLMGGTLKVASKENVGSTFSFTLPLKAVKEKPSQVQLNSFRMVSDGKEKIDISSKKRGYFQFTHSPYADEKGRNEKVAEVSTPRQMYEESFANSLQLGDSFQTGEGEKILAENPLGNEEIMPLFSGRDVSRPSCPPSYCDVSSELSHRRGYASASETTSESSESLLAKNNAVGSRVSTTQLSPGRPSNSGSNPEPRPLRLPKILLAEDNKVNVMVAQSMLKRLGHSLEVVSNGAEAVQAYQKSDYDLILMDVSMPVMDGLEATRLIRRFEETGQWLYSEEKCEAERSGLSSISGDLSASRKTQKSETASMLVASTRRRTPIIAMTANALADNVVECYSHGMDSFIAKPVTFNKLEQVLKEFIPWLDHRRGAGG